MSSENCRFAGRCSGCPWITKSFELQTEEKRDTFVRLWREQALPPKGVSDFTVRTVKEFRTRERLDLVLQTEGPNRKLGLYEPVAKSLLDLDSCPQATHPLEDWLVEFRKELPKISKGSIRLRANSEGHRGVWLDFANLDVKTLIEEKNWLRSLHSKVVVEIGQRKKRLIEKQGSLGLGDGEVRPWIKTLFKGNPTPLYTAVGSFTQPGTAVNLALVETLLEATCGLDRGDWLELGSGAGNFTIPLAGEGHQVTAVEIDPMAIQGLEISVRELEIASKVKILSTTFEKPTPLLKEAIAGKFAILADPPRSGLKTFLPTLAELEPSTQPEHFVYVTCYPESFVHDALTLYGMGYRLTFIRGVDQFPQTPHLELIARFSKK